MKVVAIHQPEYLPWLGFFKKMINSENNFFKVICEKAAKKGINEKINV